MNCDENILQQNCYFVFSGRVHGIRESGSKLVFYVLQSEGVKLQIMANLQAYESNEIFYADVGKIKRGDIIGVKGYPTRTKTGELSIVPRKMELLSPCLHAMPHYYGLKDKVILVLRMWCWKTIRSYRLIWLILGNSFSPTLLGSYHQHGRAEEVLYPVSDHFIRPQISRQHGLSRGRNSHDEHDCWRCSR